MNPFASAWIIARWITWLKKLPISCRGSTTHRLGGAIWFSTLHLTSGYWQLEVDHKREETSLDTPTDLYQFCVMPLNLWTSYGKSPWRVEVGHLSCVPWCHHCTRTVVRRTNSASNGGFEAADPRRTEVVGEKGQIVLRCMWCFWGMSLPEDGSWPIQQRLRKYRTGLHLWIKWKFSGSLHVLSSVQWCFCTLTKRLTTVLLLTDQSREEKFALDTDASQFAVGAVLSQQQGGIELVIAYFSKNLGNQNDDIAWQEKSCSLLGTFITTSTVQN